jgi:hypothetical protein
MDSNKLSKIIGNAVVFNPKTIATMLNKNGVTINAESLNTKELIDAVVAGLANSISFSSDFESFVNNEYANATGDWISGGVSVLTGALGLIAGKQQQDAIKAQANAQAKSAQAQLEIAKINQQTELAKLEALKQGGGSVKSNTGLYIGLGVGGVVILGLIVYLATKK